MSVLPHLDDLPYARPDVAEVRRATDALLSSWDRATSVQERVRLVRRWDASRRGPDQMKALAQVRFAQDTRLTENQVERAFNDRIGPDLDEQDRRFLRRVVAPEHRADLAALLGEHLLAGWELDLSTLDSRIAKDRRRESELGARYDTLKADVRVDFRGASLTASQMGRYAGDADRCTRREAASATSWSTRSPGHRHSLRCPSCAGPT